MIYDVRGATATKVFSSSLLSVLVVTFCCMFIVLFRAYSVTVDEDVYVKSRW